MKTFKLVSVGSALAVLAAAAAPAFAVTVTPPGSGGAAIPLTAHGPTTLTKSGVSISCTATLTGTIDGAGDVKITSASFTGNSLCSSVVAAKTPWTGTVLSPTQLALHGVAVNVNVPILGGACGPTDVSAGISVNATQKETLISLSKQALSGGCDVSGTLTTTPFLQVK